MAELQARVEQYERGEIERNVALQAAAKRLKEENEALKKENAELKQMMETSVCHSCSSKRKYLKRSAENAADDVGNESSRGRPVRANPSKRMRSARGELFSYVASQFADKHSVYSVTQLRVLYPPLPLMTRHSSPAKRAQV